MELLAKFRVEALAKLKVPALIVRLSPEASPMVKSPVIPAVPTTSKP